MKIIARTFMSVGAAVCMALNISSPVAAEAFPSKPISLVVPVAAGGGTDFAARLLAEDMGKRLGESIVVENRPGGAGNIGVGAVARAKADGYNLVMPITSFPINASLYSNLPFDTQKDLVPVALAATLPLVLVVNAKVPANTIQELVALAKEKPGTLNFANSGVGTTAHLAGELFKQAADIDLVSVAYKGGGPAVTDLLGGHVEIYFSTPPAVLPHIADGRLRALAVTSGERLAELPNVPTLVESGFSDLEVEAWFGLFAPAGTPEATIAKLNQAANASLNTGEVRKQMADHGFQAQGNMSSEELARYLDGEIKRWATVIKGLGLKASL